MIALHGKCRLFPETKFLGRSRLVRLRANGRNIVGCYMLRPFAHSVASCWMLLRVVAESLKQVKLFAPCKRTQHCWLTTPDKVGSFCARLHLALNLKLI